MRLLFMYLILLPFVGWAQKDTASWYHKDRIYVKFKDDISIPNATAANVNAAGELPFITSILSAKEIRKITKPFFSTSSLPSSKKLQKVYKIQLTDPDQIGQVLQQLNQDPRVEHVGRVPILRLDHTPNDYYYTVGNTGYYYSPYWLEKIEAPKAWDITKGSSNIVVAVVDDAVETSHEDLAENIVAGFDVGSNDNDPNPPSTAYSHGTHVAGIVSARTDNGFRAGIASIGYNVKIMPIKAANGSTFPDGGLKITDGYDGVTWAAEHGARVINMSWGGPAIDPMERLAINDAVTKGCILIASAGNEGSSILRYPASLTNVMGVANTTRDDIKYTDSNYGSWVDISAPGTTIRSTIPYGNYEFYTGTSMASPLVAGLAALMLSANPTMSAVQVQTGLKATADNIDAQNPSYVGQLGAGRINAFKAVKWATTVNSTASGSWTGSNWTFQAPSIYTNPVIMPGHTITVPSATYQVRNNVDIQGNLNLSTTSSNLNINN
ncbi:hypothetical protein GCM10027592_31760 [Spirosoma flavus]